MPRSLEQWLAYQVQVHPQAIDLGLDRLRQVLERLGWRQPRVPVITVAGTNGKGSVTGFCAAIMRAAGYRVGTFTSPHLRDYRERIRIHDARVSAEALVSAFERIEAARGNVGLTFFEFNTLAALLVFEAAQLDAWVLEIGMGGRLDAVNVVDADVAVVVSIGLDHQEYLGTTLDAIAREKAGIFRKGRPAVLGSTDMPGVVEETARATAHPSSARAPSTPTPWRGPPGISAAAAGTCRICPRLLSRETRSMRMRRLPSPPSRRSTPAGNSSRRGGAGGTRRSTAGRALSSDRSRHAGGRPRGYWTSRTIPPRRA